MNELLARTSLLLVALLGFSRVPAQTWQVFDVASGNLPNNTVRSLAVAPNGDVWVGTEFGLCTYDGGVWQTFQSGSSGLADNDVRALAVDDTGTVWVGTLSGLSAYHQGTWTTWTMNDSPLPENYVRSLAVAPQGGIWVGTTGGLAWFDGDTTWHVYDDTPASHNGLVLPGLNIAALTTRADGLLCAGTVNAGFTYLTDTSVTVYTTFANGLPDNTALGVGIDPQGWRWLACPAGALLHHAGDFIGGAWYQYSTLNSMLPSNSLTCIVVDGADRKLIGNLISGLTIFQGFSSFTTYNTLNSGLPSNEVMSIATDAMGGVWVGTSNSGVARFSYAASVGDDLDGLPAVSVMVDPFLRELSLSWPLVQEVCYVSLWDMQGRMVGQWRAADGQARIPMGMAAPGAYVARVVAEKGGSIGAVRVFMP